MRALFVIALIIATGCTRSFPEYEAFTAQLAGADEMILYEGLPHQDAEPDVLQAELARSDVVKMHDWPFYEEPLPLTVADAEMLMAILQDTDGFWKRPKDAATACTGFHPDYCIEWKKGEKKYRILVCFGCGEFECYGLTEPVYCWMKTETRKSLASVSKPYRQNRPEPKRIE